MTPETAKNLSEIRGPRVHLRTCGETRYYPETSPARKASPYIDGIGYRWNRDPGPPVVGALNEIIRIRRGGFRCRRSCCGWLLHCAARRRRAAVEWWNCGSVERHTVPPPPCPTAPPSFDFPRNPECGHSQYMQRLPQRSAAHRWLLTRALQRSRCDQESRCLGENDHQVARRHDATAGNRSAD